VPGKVLIADDSLKIQKELKELLEEAGVEVATVSNGEHAVRQLPTFKPDLVLADLFMPVRTGYEVCEYVKTNPDFAGTAVVLLVSKMEPFDEAEAQRVGADGKVEKPFADPGEALATIQEHLNKVLVEKGPPPIDEFAAAVPAAAEEEPPAATPEPEPEVFATAPEQVAFDEESTPQGFTEMVEGEQPAETAAAPEAALAEPEEEDREMGETTLVTSAEELQRRIQAERAAQEAPPEVEAEPVEEEAPTAEIAEAFAETVAEETPAEAVVEMVAEEEEESMDLSSATILTSADELKKRIEAERAEVTEGTATIEPAEVEEAEIEEAEVEPEPAAVTPEPEPEPEPEIVTTQQEEVPSPAEAVIEKPELAEAWEMTGPEAGAPEIPPAGGEGWDSQWKDTGEAAAVEEAPAEAEEAEVEGEVPAEAAAEGFSAGEFAAAFGGKAAAEEAIAEEPPAVEDAVVAEELAQQLPGAPAPVEEAPAEELVGVEEDAAVAEELAEALPGGAATPVDPDLVDEVVNQVLERLSPEVMETIAREIVRPLAEAILREKLRD
jgi:CheY-like chemotaxis protein